MIIIAGHTLIDAHKRDAAVEAFADMVERARKYDGCLDLSISADSVDPDASTSSSAGATSIVERLAQGRERAESQTAKIPRKALSQRKGREAILKRTIRVPSPTRSGDPLHLFIAVLLILAAFPIRAQQKIFDVHVHLHRGESSLGEYMEQAKSSKLHVTGFGAMWFGGPSQALQGDPDAFGQTTTT